MYVNKKIHLSRIGTKIKHGNLNNSVREQQSWKDMEYTTKSSTKTKPTVNKMVNGQFEPKEFHPYQTCLTPSPLSLRPPSNVDTFPKIRNESKIKKKKKKKKNGKGGRSTYLYCSLSYAVTRPHPKRFYQTPESPNPQREGCREGCYKTMLLTLSPRVHAPKCIVLSFSCWPFVSFRSLCRRRGSRTVTVRGREYVF